MSATRTLAAVQISTGKWFQRLDTGDKATTAFAAEVAEQFGVAATDVRVIEGVIASEDDRRVIVDAMASGTYASVAVLATPTVPPSPRVLAFARRVHLNLAGADAAAKWARALWFRQRSLAVGLFVADLRLTGDLPASVGALAVIRADWMLVKNDAAYGVLGLDPGHLTADEAAAIEQDAATHYGFSLT